MSIENAFLEKPLHTPVLIHSRTWAGHRAYLLARDGDNVRLGGLAKNLQGESLYGVVFKLDEYRDNIVPYGVNTTILTPTKRFSTVHDFKIFVGDQKIEAYVQSGCLPERFDLADAYFQLDAQRKARQG